jgi:predicted aminopeptidase
MADVDQSAHARAALEADKKRQEEARKKVKDDRAARDKASKEMSSSDVKPTPSFSQLRRRRNVILRRVAFMLLSMKPMAAKNRMSAVYNPRTPSL